MKKVLNMRVAIILMALTLITSCFVGGTLAKYVTEGKGEDTARVAKFGVVVTGTGEAFAKTYATDDASFTGTFSVSSGDDDKVVAPGTSGDMAAFAITGTPEVAVRVAFTASTVEFGDNWIYNDGTDDSYYCPIEITVGSTTLKGNDYANVAAFEAAISDAIDDYTKDYEAGTDLSLIGVDAPAISWAWAFESNSDVKDTYLGDQAAAGNAATITLAITVTVTQID